MSTWWRRAVSREVDRFRKDGPQALAWSLRITVAAVSSYVVALLLFPGTQPLLAPLTAMLVVQVTPVTLLASGVDRVVSVVSGVFLAVVFAALVPLEWWSLGLLILVSLMLGQALRLQSNLIEVAISAMLVLGVGSLSAGTAAWQRITETLVGAAVGVVANLLFPPKVATADAGKAIDGLADSICGLLTGAADGLVELVHTGADPRPATLGWLEDARRINHDIPQVGAALLHAEQGRRLNVRAVGQPDVGPGLRQGLEALEHSSVAVRGLFRALADAAHDATWLADEVADDVLLGLAQTLRELAAGIDAFGQLVRDEGDLARTVSAADLRSLRGSLEGLHEARARLDDLLVAGLPPGLVELHAAELATVKRLQREMDVDERVRRQVRMVRSARPRYPRLREPTLQPRPGRSESPPPDPETQVLRRVEDDDPDR